MCFFAPTNLAVLNYMCNARAIVSLSVNMPLAPARDTVLYCVLTRLARARVRLDHLR